MWRWRPTVLSYNVADLLRAAPGAQQRFQLELPELPLSDDLRLAAPIAGQLRLIRTGRSVLAQAELSTALEGACSRCLRPVVAPIDVTIEEEALPLVDIDSGLPVDVSGEPDALRLDAHHELDMATPIREAIVLAEPINLLCRPDCAGLCQVCGIDLNENEGHSHADQDVDPRLAALADWQPAADNSD
jgi:uncharacterized protein